jgi:hypothetical protein
LLDEICIEDISVILSATDLKSGLLLLGWIVAFQTQSFEILKSLESKKLKK